MLTNRMTWWQLAAALGLLLAREVTAQETPQNYDNNWANGNAPYSNAAPADHRAIQPFNPVGFEQPLTPFAPAEISDYGVGPKAKYGFFFGYDRLLWTYSRPRNAQIGSPAAEGFYIENGQSVFEANSLETNMFPPRVAWGNRYEFGYMDVNNYGWLVSVLDHVRQAHTKVLSDVQMLVNDPNNLLFGFRDANGDGIDDDTNQNGIPGRGPNNILLAAGLADFGDRTFLFPRFKNFVALEATTTNGVEVMRMYRAPRLHNGGYFEFLYGARYLQINDDFQVDGSNDHVITVTSTTTNNPTGVTPPSPLLNPAANALDVFFLHHRVHNNIVGPQLGGRYYHQRGRWIFSTEGRVFAAINFETVKQETDIASLYFFPAQVNGPVSTLNPDGSLTTQTITYSGSNIPALNLVPHSTQASQFRNVFSPGAELRFQTSFQATQAIAIKAGYTALFVDGIARAANRVDYTVPEFGILRSGARQQILMNGLNIGFEINR